MSKVTTKTKKKTKTKEAKAKAKPKSAKKKGTSKKSSAARGGKSLVIVESPAKARTISKYLPAGYAVKATVGHIRDLPQRELGGSVARAPV